MAQQVPNQDPAPARLRKSKKISLACRKARKYPWYVEKQEKYPWYAEKQENILGMWKSKKNILGMWKSKTISLVCGWLVERGGPRYWTAAYTQYVHSGE
jgi:hypothetical protein